LYGKVFQPLGILGIAVLVCPVVFAVILDADLPIGPTHIVAAATDSDLGDRAR